VSKGGIVLALANQEAQDILNFIGKVVALGPQAGKHERLGGDGKEAGPDFPKVGEYIAFGRFAGQKIVHRGVKLLLCNDDEILAVIPNPETLQTSK
jgi:co-chaperonin GroES (HSP10)